MGGCRSTMPPDSVRRTRCLAALLAAYSEAAKEKDDDGRLPLHVAAGSKASVAVVAALLEAYPEAAKEKGREGNLPLLLRARLAWLAWLGSVRLFLRARSCLACSV